MLQKKYDFDSKTIIILEQNMGGTQNVHWFSVLLITKKGKIKISETFDSSDGTFVSNIDANESIIIDLGFEDGFKKVAKYENGRLKIINTIPTKLIADEQDCKYLYDSIYKNFIAQQRCTEDTNMTLGLSSYRYLKQKSHNPKFNLKPLEPISIEGCISNESISYSSFKKTICHGLTTIEKANQTESSCYKSNISYGNFSNDRKKYKDSTYFYNKSYDCAFTPKNKVAALGSLAMVKLNLGKRQEAKKHINDLLKLSPENKWALKFKKDINIKDTTKNTIVSKQTHKLNNNKKSVRHTHNGRVHNHLLPKAGLKHNHKRQKTTTANKKTVSTSESLKIDRALKNYNLYVSGLKKLSDFSPEERKYMLRVANYYATKGQPKGKLNPKNNAPRYTPSRGIVAYQTKVDSDNGDIIKLENGAIVEISSYFGYLGYRKSAVLFGNGSNCNLWIAGKKSYKCELIKKPSGMGVSAEKVYISEVKGNGSIIKMLDGRIYEVDSFSQFNAALWLGMSDGLIINGSTLINFQSTEEVKITLVR